MRQREREREVSAKQYTNKLAIKATLYANNVVFNLTVKDDGVMQTMLCA